MLCPSCDHDNIPGTDLCEHCGLDLAGLDIEAVGVDDDDPLLKTKLGSLPLKEPVVLGPTATVREAIALLNERQEGCLFVLEPDGALVGVVTEHDITTRVAAPGRDPRKIKLEDIMTPNPVSLEVADPFAWALHRMGVDGHRHLPVLRDGELCGFLSSRTVLEQLLVD